jgi:hypothetical protein
MKNETLALIRAGKCPWGCLEEGQGIGHCPLGFPGCNCADELMEAALLDEGLWPEEPDELGA